MSRVRTNQRTCVRYVRQKLRADVGRKVNRFVNVNEGGMLRNGVRFSAQRLLLL